MTVNEAYNLGVYYSLKYRKKLNNRRLFVLTEMVSTYTTRSKNV